MSADYFPLRAGRVMAYKTRSPQGTGTSELKVLQVTSTPVGVEARCERVVVWQNEPPQTSAARVAVDRSAVRVDGDIEFTLPVIRGAVWEQPPRRYEITHLDASVRTDAGDFKGCVEVSYTIAGGDAGFGRRLYAPDVGFVYESCADEVDPFEIQLTAVRG